jgi:hypothetical protein
MRMFSTHSTGASLVLTTIASRQLGNHPSNTLYTTETEMTLTSRPLRRPSSSLQP